MVKLTRDSLGDVVQELPYELASAAAPVRLRDVRIVDTTCRDGEQMPGISFTIDEKLDMCRGLEAIGIEQVETFATYNDSDRNCARQLAESARTISIMGWNRMVAADIEDTRACFDPQVIICSAVVPMDDDDRVTWVTLPTDPSKPTEVRLAGGRRFAQSNPTFIELLEIIDETVRLAKDGH